jgi:hypothetical protein
MTEQADHYLGEWTRARDLLLPMIKMAEVAGSPTLVGVLEETLEMVEVDVRFWQRQMEQLGAEF